MKRSKYGLFVFPPKKTLIRRGHPSIGQCCCSMTSKQSIDWFLESSRAWQVFSPERSLNQSKATSVCIRSTNQSYCSISVLLLFLFCSRVFISRSYENRSIHHYTSLSITIHHYPSLHITTHHYPSLSITTHHYPSLSITSHHCPLLHITVDHYTTLSITTQHCPSLHITVHHYTSLSIISHHCPLLHITVHHYTSLSITSSHHCPSLHITIHRYPSLHITTITIHHYTSNTSLPITTHHYTSLLITPHHLQPPRSSDSTSALNFLEICLLCAVIHYFKNSGKQCGVDDVQAMYIKVIDSLIEIGIALQLEMR